MIKYMGFTDEEINLYESLTNDTERNNFKKMHPHSLKYEVIIETILSFLLKVLNQLKHANPNCIAIHACNKQEMDKLEVEWIEFWKPIYNIQHNS